MSDFNWGIFSVTFTSTLSLSLPVFLLLLVFPLCAFTPFVVVPKSLDVLFCFFQYFFSLLSVLEVFVEIIRLRGFSHVQSAVEPSKAFFISVTGF